LSWVDLDTVQFYFCLDFKIGTGTVTYLSAKIHRSYLYSRESRVNEVFLQFSKNSVSLKLLCLGAFCHKRLGTDKTLLYNVYTGIYAIIRTDTGIIGEIGRRLELTEKHDYLNGLMFNSTANETCFASSFVKHETKRVSLETLPISEATYRYR
jgi:hypothetical protein